MKNLIWFFVAMSPSLAFAVNSKVEKGMTSIFYTGKVTDVNGQKTKCAQKSIVDPKGKVLARLCEKEARKCRMEGSCLVKTEKGDTLINVADRKGRTFEVIDPKKCKYGTGAIINKKRSCLIPYKSLACGAGKKAGDVIHIKEAENKPYRVGNGPLQYHDGNFICSDTGERVRAAGHFDVFTGYEGDPESELTKIVKSSGKVQNVTYAQVVGGKLKDDNDLIKSLQQLALTNGEQPAAGAVASRDVASAR